MQREVPTKFVEQIVTTPVLKLKFRERIKVLFGAPINVMVVTQCQHRPGKTKGKFNHTIGKKNGFGPTEIIRAVNMPPTGEEANQERAKI